MSLRIHLAIILQNDHGREIPEWSGVFEAEQLDELDVRAIFSRLSESRRRAYEIEDGSRWLAMPLCRSVEVLADHTGPIPEPEDVTGLLMLRFLTLEAAA